MLESIEAFAKLFGPIIGTIVGGMLIPAIIVLWKKTDRLEREKDELQRKWREKQEEFIKIGAKQVEFSEQLLRLSYEDAPNRDKFREQVRELILRQDEHRPRVIGMLDDITRKVN